MKEWKTKKGLLTTKLKEQGKKEEMRSQEYETGKRST